MTKSLLSKLNITEAPPKHPTDPLIQRQNKLIARLEVQREMARCLVENEEFKAFKYKYVIDQETGIKNKVRVPKQIKPWFYKIDEQYFTPIKYGSKSLELAKGLYAIAVKDSTALTGVYDVVIEAVKAGEFDSKLMAIKAVGKK
ncbi:DUF6641 family protein [Litorilituus lipolyticus]|uniref:Uncharacterized protein n=1 Tax=Litorilituus lipolyticus TaxID=2491017 RepID=A0A502KU48_9GAMM|nr:DUF6641 family protein [Litorilituus lipolyticus]TPH13929.1 hypothetical protein EPA86_12495 [Litorilituus lipolyticus]